MTIYLVGVHDNSWGNTGDYILRAFTDKKLADEQYEWYKKHLHLFEGDYVTYETMEISDKISTQGDDMTIMELLYEDPND